MPEYIEREAAIKCIESQCVDGKMFGNDESEGTLIEAYDAIDALDEIPSADVAPVRHAYWVPEERVDRISAAVTYRNTRYLCSSCGRALLAWEKPIDAPYCHCGAKMDGGVEREN